MRYLRMSKFIEITAIWVLLQSGPALSQPTSETFNIAEDPQFSNHRTALVEYLVSKKIRGTQDFCILGQIARDRTKSSWIIWRQGHAMISWHGEGEPLKWASRKIDLKKDVVDSERDLKGSTYLVTKAWVKDIKKQCEQNGTHARITEKDLFKKSSESIRRAHDHVTGKK